MSNGGFGGIHGKLLAKLAEKSLRLQGFRGQRND